MYNNAIKRYLLTALVRRRRKKNYENEIPWYSITISSADVKRKQLQSFATKQRPLFFQSIIKMSADKTIAVFLDSAIFPPQRKIKVTKRKELRKWSKEEIRENNKVGDKRK